MKIINYKKLIDLLCEVEEVKKDLEFQTEWFNFMSFRLLEERHLRMYCDNIWKYSNIYSDWDLYIQWAPNFIKIDNSKSFDNQSEEVYEKICNAINNIKNKYGNNNKLD
jgi:hypothetical protein